jgi:transcriptional regulator of acetoin/glycerol metabolism
METETDSFSFEPRRDRDVRIVLQLTFQAGDPLAPPSRHLLDGVDAVWFARGKRAAVRDRKDGLRRLVLSVPDPKMSSDHGRLIRARGGWVLDTSSAKNTALVDGARTPSARIANQQMFALGHTLFTLGAWCEPADAPTDLVASDLPGGARTIGTFDPALAASIGRLERIADTHLAVLLQGETGTGKEVVARMVHARSQRPGAFVAVNCSAITRSLVEAELFGHRRGAYTGAVADRPGLVRAADRGTLFLDEIAELPLDMQATLLRTLQEREVTPVGDAAPIAVDFRVIAATHRDLRAMIAAGQFREDLYARLGGLVETLPPLRARRCDLGILIAALLHRLPRCEQVRFTPAAAIALLTYDWPRNIRELEQTLSAAAALAGTDPITLEHLPEAVLQREVPTPAAALVPATALTPAETALKQELERLLRVHGGKVTAVARSLGKAREQVYRWLRRFGVHPRAYRP